MRHFKPVFILLYYCAFQWVTVPLVSGQKPVNDICLEALPIAIGTTTIGNTTGATSDVDQVVNQNGCNETVVQPNAPGIWYKFQGTGGHV